MSILIHLVSNMYPSAEYPAFGIFVKEMTEKIRGLGPNPAFRGTGKATGQGKVEGETDDSG